jgi:hypothetical protein
VRYFRQDAATANTYKIDPDMIFGGGSSAGAFCALHLAYLDQPHEVPSAVDTMVMGGLEGTSGNPGYPSNINAVLNLCGAMGDTAWMVSGDIPVCSMHGTTDAVVPYSTAMLYLLQAFPIMVVNGSYSVNEHAMLIGNEQTMYTYYGVGHVPYSSNVDYMDTTVRFVSNFLYRQLGCTPRDPFPEANTWNTVSVNEISEAPLVEVFPNPAESEFTIRIAQPQSGSTIKIFDALGKEVFAAQIRDHELHIQPQFAPGIYFIKLRSLDMISTTKLVVK